MEATVEASFELSLYTDIFSNVLFRSLYGTLGFLTIHQSINVKFFELPEYFTFQIILRFMLCFVFLSCIPILVIVFKEKA